MLQEMRFMAGSPSGWKGQNPLTDVILRALQQAGGWSVEAMRRPGFRLMETIENDGGFRTLAPLVDKAQVQIDRAVVEVGLDRLTVAADIMARNPYPLGDPLSIAQLEWYAVSKTGNAQRTMSPSARGETQLPQLSLNRLPIYLTTAKFEIDIRTLRTSQRIGTPIDTAQIKQGVRSVNEAIEDAAINGATTLDGQALAVAGYSAPGLLNATGAETQSLTAAAWTTTPVPATILAQVQLMIAKLQANKKYGPYNLYVGTQIGNVLDTDYTTSTSTVTTVRQRLLQIDSIQSIKVADMLTSGNGATPSIGNKVILVQLTSDVADMVVGQPPTVIPWTSLDGFTIHNLIMAILIPRVRSDYDGNSGICVGTTA